MSSLKIEIKWALIFIAVSLSWMIFEKSMGWHDVLIEKHAIYTNFFAVFAIGVYVLALLDKKNAYFNGNMTFKEGFLSGLVITIIIVLLSPVSQYIALEFITPEYFSNVIDYTVASGNLDQKSAEEYFNLQSYIIQAMIGAFVLGLITSAGVSFFVKSKSKAA